MVNQRRSMGYLDENIFSDFVSFCVVVCFRQTVVKEQISCHSCALCLPVKPQAAGTAVNVVAAYDHVNGRMHLDASDFGAAQILLIVDVMDLIVFYDREYPAKMPYNSCLSTVVDVASSDGVGAYPLLTPSLPLCLTDAVPLCLRAVLIFPPGPLIIVFRL